MDKIRLELESPTAGLFANARQITPYTSYLTPTRPRLRRLRLFLISACAIAATACASLSAPGNGEGEPITQADMDAVRAEADQAMTATKAAEAALSEAQAAADAAVSAAQADADQARAEAAAAQADADQALADATVAQQDAARARAGESEAMARVDAMMMAAHHPSEVMVGPDMLDIRLLNLDQAQASLAGRDSIYISSIRYDGAMFSALLKYEGGTTATVEAIFGESGKLIPDTVGLGLTELAVLAPDKLVVSNIEVGGMGYSGELQYVGGNRLQVAGIRRVALPPTAAEQIAALEAELAAAQAAADAAMAEAEAAMADTATAMAETEAAMADTATAMAETGAAMADTAAAMAEAEAAMAKVDAMMMAAHHPAEVMVSAAMLDPSMANLDHAQVSLAGPDSIYVSNIMYDGVPYSALLKYSGGTSATVVAVYGPMGKLIPDSVGLAQTELAFVPPASLAVSNVAVGDVGYSGTLEYAGGNQLRVTGIRRVTLPPTVAEAAAAAIAQAEANAAAAVSGAQAAAEAAMADAEAAMADKAAAMADAEAAMAAAGAAEAEAAAAQAKVDAMMAEAYQPSEVMVSAAMLDPSMANLDQVQFTLAGPDSIYVSNIMYGGVPYSALLRYRGGTTATVEAVYGPMGKLIPDSVGLAQTAAAFVAPASLAVENVDVGGVGYSGTLEYAGGNQLRVTGIRRVNLPPTEAEMAQAENESLKATIAEQSDQITALHRGGSPGGRRPSSSDGRQCSSADRWLADGRRRGREGRNGASCSPTPWGIAADRSKRRSEAQAAADTAIQAAVAEAQAAADTAMSRQCSSGSPAWPPPTAEAAAAAMQQRWPTPRPRMAEAAAAQAKVDADDGGGLPALRGDGLRRHARSEPGEHRPRSGIPGTGPDLHLRLQHHVRRRALLGTAQVQRRHLRHRRGCLRADGQAAPRLRGAVSGRAGLRGACFPRRLHRERRSGRGRLLRYAWSTPGGNQLRVTGIRRVTLPPTAGGSSRGGDRTGRGRCGSGDRTGRGRRSGG